MPPRVRRKLSPAEQEAARTFRRLLEAEMDRRSQQAIADDIGVTQGAVWQWADGKIPISAKRAQAAARAVQGNPAAISVAFRELNLTPEKLPPGSGGTSHSATLDPDIVHETLTLLFHDEWHAGEYSPRGQAQRFTELYARVAADGGRLTKQHNAQFEAEIEARRLGGSGGGTNQAVGRRAARRRRR